MNTTIDYGFGVVRVTPDNLYVKLWLVVPSDTFSGNYIPATSLETVMTKAHAIEFANAIMAATEYTPAIQQKVKNL